MVSIKENVFIIVISKLQIFTDGDNDMKWHIIESYYLSLKK